MKVYPEDAELFRHIGSLDRYDEAAQTPPHVSCGLEFKTASERIGLAAITVPIANL